jgi:hypothetical protein
MYLLGSLFYADPLHFWQHARSEIRITKTLLGTPNLPSALIVMTGMFIAVRLLLEAARVYRDDNCYPNRPLKIGFLYTTSLRAFFSISPVNLLHLIHTIGSAMLTGGVFLLTLAMAWEFRILYDSVKIYLVMISLGFTVLAYTVTYFNGLEIKLAIQKIYLAYLSLILYQRSRISPYLFPLENPSTNLRLKNS